MLSDVSTATCKEYVKVRGNSGGARRDLEDLRAAIHHHASENLHRAIVNVWLPPKGAPRDRWLTRSEVARLLWACWRHREIQRRHRGSAEGQKLPTGKRPLRHLARFVLIGIYTGTRASAIAGASPQDEAGRIVPHTLRHTAATWLMQRGVSIWQAAGYLGMSAETLDRVYGHHSPDHLKGAANAIAGKSTADVSVVGGSKTRKKFQK